MATRYSYSDLVNRRRSKEIIDKKKGAEPQALSQSLPSPNNQSKLESVRAKYIALRQPQLSSRPQPAASQVSNPLGFPEPAKMDEKVEAARVQALQARGQVSKPQMVRAQAPQVNPPIIPQRRRVAFSRQGFMPAVPPMQQRFIPQRPASLPVPPAPGANNKRGVGLPHPPIAAFSGRPAEYKPSPAPARHTPPVQPSVPVKQSAPILPSKPASFPAPAKLHSEKVEAPKSLPSPSPRTLDMSMIRGVSAGSPPLSSAGLFKLRRRLRGRKAPVKPQPQVKVAGAPPSSKKPSNFPEPAKMS